MVSKKRKTGAAFVATSTGAEEEVAKNIGGGSASAPTSTEGKQSAASVDLGGDNFV